MSEVVKLTKGQAKAIESQLKKESTSEIVWARLAPQVTYYNEATPINGIDPDTLIKALYIGYEVEQTPEDELREMFIEALKQERTLTPNSSRHQFWSGRRMAIVDTLNTLNKKIEGINT